MIGSKYFDNVTTQDYSRKPTIEGVSVINLPHYVDEGGSFCELARIEDNYFDVKQISYANILPGVIKAFHIHNFQDDLWFIPPTERLLINLVDLRPLSHTYNIIQKVILGAGKASLLHIPSNVAHGCCNLSDKPVNLIYFTNKVFNIDSPDELRLKWDYFGSYLWEVGKE